MICNKCGHDVEFIELKVKQLLDIEIDSNTEFEWCVKSIKLNISKKYVILHQEVCPYCKAVDEYYEDLEWISINKLTPETFTEECEIKLDSRRLL